MKLRHLSHNHYIVSDASAGILVREVNTKLPKPGYEVSVVLPNGMPAWLKRTPYQLKARGWVWAVMPKIDGSVGEKRKGQGNVYDCNRSL